MLYNGKKTWTASRQFRKLLHNEALFGGELIDFESHTKGGVSIMGFEKALDAIKREGKQEGRQEGRQEEKEDTAKKMLAEQFDAAVISRITGYSMEQIDRLRQQMEA